MADTKDTVKKEDPIQGEPPGQFSFDFKWKELGIDLTPYAKAILKLSAVAWVIWLIWMIYLSDSASRLNIVPTVKKAFEDAKVLAERERILKEKQAKDTLETYRRAHAKRKAEECPISSPSASAK